MGMVGAQVKLTPGRLARFGARAVLIYGMLIAGGSVLEEAHTPVIVRGASAVLYLFHLEERILVESFSRNQTSRIRIRVSSPRDAGTPRVALSDPYYLIYLPVVTFIALMLAVSPPFRRQKIDLLIGMIWIHVFVYFRLTCIALYLLFRDEPGIGHGVNYAATVLYAIFARGSEMTFVGPVLIWIILFYRGKFREEIRSLNHTNAMDRFAAGS